jgi:hypothetical protein
MALHAVLNIELGYMREGLRDLHDTYPVLPDQLKRSFSGKLVESMLLSGLTPLEYAPAIGEDSSAKAVALVRFAGLMDDTEHARAFLKQYGGDDRTGLPDDSIWEAYAKGLVADGKDAVANFLKAVEAERNRIAVRPAQDFAYTACAAHLARVSGDKKARKLHEEAEVLLNSLDKQVTPQVMALALHHRNALEVYPENSKAKQAKAARNAAHKFFKHHYEQGYGAFAKFL